MIFFQTINGKKVRFETNTQGDIISRDGEPIKSDKKTFEEVREEHLKKQHKYHYGFMQRGNNQRKY